ncbi:MAG TPA: Ig domain-containing protein [Acidimicrobiales bacterium]|nr:Ig domain-containing protein [Acidimicrobiales bacterium]
MSDPTAGHSYRHGALPLVLRASASALQSPHHSPVTPSSGTAAARASSGGKLRYGGGDPSTNVGVVTGNPRVYLVLWGAWSGAGDPAGVATLLQQFLTGLGTNHELWSGTALQYCQNLGAGSTSCPASDPHVPYPTSDVLAGTWFDTTGYPGDNAPTGSDLAAEAEKAAAHFGNTTQASNANAQYVIASPSNTDPDGWLDPNTGYCAYHDNTTDPSIDGAGPVAGPDVPFTNLPYVADVGSSCGANAVNPGLSGTTDGVTIAEGHEYYETLTDPYPSTPTNAAIATGWTDRRGSEIGDKCEFLQHGQAGGPDNIILATGTFAVQGMWANNSGRRGHCVLTEPTISFSNPGKPHSKVGTAVSLQITATDGAPGTTLTYGASGLPAGLAINAASGLISGTPTSAGKTTATVTATDNLGFGNSISVIWRVRR